MNQNAPTVSSPDDNSEQAQSEKEKAKQAQLMEQYKAYLQTIDYSAENRLHTSEFFVAINSFLGTLFGYMVTSQRVSVGKWTVLLLLLIAVVGFCVSRVWYLLLTHYTTVNFAKWEVIYDMEKDFLYQYQPFTSEWENKLSPKRIHHMPGYFSWLQKLPKSKKKPHPYYSYSDIITELPKLFGRMYIILGVSVLVYAIGSWGIKACNWISSNLDDIVLRWEIINDAGLVWVVGIIALILFFFVLVLAVIALRALWLLTKCEEPAKESAEDS